VPGVDGIKGRPVELQPGTYALTLNPQAGRLCMGPMLWPPKGDPQVGDRDGAFDFTQEGDYVLTLRVTEDGVSGHWPSVHVRVVKETKP
jgi:hypothetical protein